MNCSHANFKGLCERCSDDKGTYRDEILNEIVKMKLIPMNAREARSLKMKAKNEMLEEIINKIREL